MHDHRPTSILVATDMSARADRALTRAMDLAAGFGARLAVMHVVDEDMPPTVRDMVCEQARRLLLEQVAALPQAASVPWEVEVAPGVDVAAIVGRAEAMQAGLVVLGAHRERSFRGIIFGTTAERVMHSGTAPVLVAHGAYRGPYRLVLAAVDGSAASLRALTAALRCWPEAAVQAVHVLDLPGGAAAAGDAIEQAADRLRPALDRVRREVGRRPDLVVEVGDVDTVLRDLATRHAADLVAVGTTGGNPSLRSLLGGTTERILQSAPCDVLVVPPGL